MGILFGIVALGATLTGGGFFGAQYLKDAETQQKLQLWLVENTSLLFGFDAKTVYDFISMVAGFFGVDAGTFDMDIAGILTLADTDPAIKQRVQKALEELGLGRDVAASFLASDNRSTLLGILGEAGVEITDAQDAVKLTNKVFSETSLQHILGNPEATKLFFSELPKPFLDRLLVVQKGGGLSSINFRTLSQALITRGKDSDIGSIFFEHIREAGVTIVDGASLQELIKPRYKADLAALIESRSGGKINADQAAQTAQFLVNNAEALQTILGGGGFDQLAKLIRDGETIPNLAKLHEVLGNPEFSALRDTILTNALSGNDVETALVSLNYEGSGLQQKEITMAQNLGRWIASRSDAPNVDIAKEGSNLDVLARLARNPKAFNAVLRIMSQVAAGTQLTDIKIDTDVANTVRDAYINLNLDTADFANIAAPAIAASIKEAMKGVIAPAPQKVLDQLQAGLGGVQLGQEGTIDQLVFNNIVKPMIDKATRVER